MTCGLCYMPDAFPQHADFPNLLRHYSSPRPPRAEAGRVIQNRDIAARVGKTDKLYWSVDAPISKPLSFQKVRPYTICPGPRTPDPRPSYQMPDPKACVPQLACRPHSRLSSAL